MRRLLVSLTVALALSLASLGVAFGHVHGITPLPCLETDNANSGASAAQGVAIPEAGLIPNVVGRAGLPTGTGNLGRGAAPCE